MVDKVKKVTFKDLYNEFATKMDNNLKYIESYGWVKFNGKTWSMATLNELELLIADWLGDEFNPSAVKKFSEAFKMYNTLDISKLNRKHDKIVFTNGTYNIDTFTFERDKFYKWDMVTNSFGFEYDETAKCDLYVKYLNETFLQEQELNDIINEMMGYCLLNDCRYEKAFVMYGDGATGKSVLLKLISSMWGKENCSHIPFDRLSEPFLRATMYGKRINFTSELENNISNSAYFKAMVSGEEVDAQFKFQNTFTFANTAKMIFAMNNLPTISDKTDGIYRRFIMIPFNNKIAEENRDVHLIDKLIAERSGIMNMVLEGLKRLKTNGVFTIASTSEELKAEYRESNSMCSVNEFVKDECNVGEEYTVDCAELYDSYSNYCKQFGFKPVNNVNFGKRLVKIDSKIFKIRKREGKDRKYIYGHIALN